MKIWVYVLIQIGLWVFCLISVDYNKYPQIDLLYWILRLQFQQVLCNINQEERDYYPKIQNLFIISMSFLLNMTTQYRQQSQETNDDSDTDASDDNNEYNLTSHWTILYLGYYLVMIQLVCHTKITTKTALKHWGNYFYFFMLNIVIFYQEKNFQNLIDVVLNVFLFFLINVGKRNQNIVSLSYWFKYLFIYMTLSILIIIFVKLETHNFSNTGVMWTQYPKMLINLTEKVQFYLVEIFLLLQSIFSNQRFVESVPDLFALEGQLYIAYQCFIRNVLNFQIIDNTTKDVLKTCFQFCIFFLMIMVNVYFFNQYLYKILFQQNF